LVDPICLFCFTSGEVQHNVGKEAMPGLSDTDWPDSQTLVKSEEEIRHGSPVGGPWREAV
jgi:hypothetical protein